MISRQQFMEVMMPLASSFRHAMDDAEIEIYYRKLKSLSPQQLMRAADMIMERCEHWPAIATILRFAGQSGDGGAVYAWGLVLNAMRRYGSYQSVDFEDKAINAAVRSCGDWVDLCNSDESKLAFLRRDFERSYEVFALMTPKQIGRQGAPLFGISDKKNTATNAAPSNIRRIDRNGNEATGPDRLRLASGGDE